MFSMYIMLCFSKQTSSCALEVTSDAFSLWPGKKVSLSKLIKTVKTTANMIESSSCFLKKIRHADKKYSQTWSTTATDL